LCVCFVPNIAIYQPQSADSLIQVLAIFSQFRLAPHRYEFAVGGGDLKESPWNDITCPSLPPSTELFSTLPALKQRFIDRN
jgi:hypothetical protein